MKVFDLTDGDPRAVAIAEQLGAEFVPDMSPEDEARMKNMPLPYRKEVLRKHISSMRVGDVAVMRKGLRGSYGLRAYMRRLGCLATVRWVK